MPEVKKRKPRQESVGPEDAAIGARIRLARSEKGLTLADVSQQYNISVQQLQKYEKGLNRVSAKLLNRLSKTFAKDIRWFFSDIEDSEISPNVDADNKFFASGAKYLQKINDAQLKRIALAVLKHLSEQE